MRLKDKSILIAGAGPGMGRAMALLFSREGAQVSVVARSRDTTDATVSLARAAGHDVNAVNADISELDQAQAAVKQALERQGKLDGLVFAAGGSFRRIKPFSQVEPEFYAAVLRNHLIGAFNILRSAVPALIENGHGSIVLISAAYKTRRDGNIAYGTAKEGIIGLTWSLARELYEHNVRVNSVAPGLIRIPMSEGKLRDPQMHLRRRGMPEDVAFAAMYFLSDESPWVTGQVIAVDGGDQVLAGKPYEAD